MIGKRILHDVRGTALVEFAIVLPVLLLLFFGGYQLSDAIACKRKVTIMTRAIGDITSQYRSIPAGDLDKLIDASTLILNPYPSSAAQVRVTQITLDDTGKNFRVDWSRARNVTVFAKGSYPSTTIPLAYRQPNMVLLYTESSYNYAAVGLPYFNAMTFSEDLWLLPRRSATINLI